MEHILLQFIVLADIMLRLSGTKIVYAIDDVVDCCFGTATMRSHQSIDL